MPDVYIGSDRIDDFFAHHGIKGQKWGRRRFQNSDGTLTEEGRRRYLNRDSTLNKEGIKRYGEHGPDKLNRKALWDEERSEYSKLEKSKSKLYDKLDRRREEIEKKHTLTDDSGEPYWDDDLAEGKGPDFEELQKIDDVRYKEHEKSKKAARDYILKKYGEEGVTKIVQQERRNTAAGVLAGLIGAGIIIGTPIALIKGGKYGLKKAANKIMGG